MPTAVEPPGAQPWSRATPTGVARRESPDSWPAQGAREQRATVLSSRAPSQLSGDRDRRWPPRPPPPDAAEGWGQENNKGVAGRGRRPLPPPDSPRAGEPAPRPRPGAAARGGHTGRGPAGQPGTLRRPPPRTHQRLPAPRRTRGRLPARLSRRGAPGARPRPPRPGAAALLTPNFTSALRPQHPRSRGPGFHRHRTAEAAPTTAPPHTAHACPRRLSPQTAAEIPEPALPARRDYKSRQAPRGSRRRGGPSIGRLPGSRGGGLRATGRAARGALGPCAAVPPGIGSLRGPRGLARSGRGGNSGFSDVIA